MDEVNEIPRALLEVPLLRGTQELVLADHLLGVHRGVVTPLRAALIRLMLVETPLGLRPMIPPVTRNLEEEFREVVQMHVHPVPVLRCGCTPVERHGVGGDGDRPTPQASFIRPRLEPALVVFLGVRHPRAVVRVRREEGLLAGGGDHGVQASADRYPAGLWNGDGPEGGPPFRWFLASGTEASSEEPVTQPVDENGSAEGAAPLLSVSTRDA